MALVMARDTKDSHCREKGMSEPMIVYTSRESHYSNPKNASFAGIGKSNIRYIPTDSKGQMLPNHLEEQIIKDLDEGFVPTYVNDLSGVVKKALLSKLMEMMVVRKMI